MSFHLVQQKAVRAATTLLCATFLVTLAGCSSAGTGQGVPQLGSASPAGASSSQSSRAAALHAAAECIRTHGVPTYQDPVVTADGHVYTDSRSINDLKGDSSAQNAIRSACGSLLSAANFLPDDEAPAPPKLVAAGVKAAECLRSHGLPNYRDPSSSSPFTPGHGFGISNDELPNNGTLGKSDPTFRDALAACSKEIDAEIKASELSSLASD